MENGIERGVILGRGIELEVGSGVLPETAVVPMQSPAPRTAQDERSPEVQVPSPQSIDQVERNHILEVLMRANWRIEGADGAAALLNLKTSTLRTPMIKLGVHSST